MGYQDLIMTIPPILISQCHITDPVISSLGDARVYGSDDPNYGAIGYVPRLDGIPFAFINTVSVMDNDSVETNRIWSTYTMTIFIAIEHADTASNLGDYHLIAMGYIDQMRQVVAANRRLTPQSNTLYPTAGDVRWVMRSGRVIDRHVILGVPYYGVEITATLLLINAVNYQEN
jgi:hypothetical protein